MILCTWFHIGRAGFQWHDSTRLEHDSALTLYFPMTMFPPLLGNCHSFHQKHLYTLGASRYELIQESWFLTGWWHMANCIYQRNMYEWKCSLKRALHAHILDFEIGVDWSELWSLYWYYRTIPLYIPSKVNLIILAFPLRCPYDMMYLH